MAYENLFTFFIACDTDVSLNTIIPEKIKDFTLKTVFRDDICKISNENIKKVDLLSLLDDSKVMFTDLNDNTKFEVVKSELVIFNTSFEKEKLYSMITITAKISSDQLLDIATLNKKFCKFNKYNIIKDEQCVKPLYETLINGVTKKYKAATDEDTPLQDIKPISSIIQLLAGDMIRQINIGLSNKANRVEYFDYLWPVFKYYVNWLTLFIDSDNTPITEREHKIAKQFVLGHNGRYVSNNTPYREDIVYDYYTSFRSALIYNKGEFYTNPQNVKNYYNYFVNLYLFAYNEYVTINRHIQEIQGRLTNRIDVIKNKDDINKEMDVFNEFISKYSFDNPTVFEHYNIFFNRIKEAHNIEKSRQELEVDRNILNSDIMKEETLRRDKRNRNFWVCGIFGQIALGFIAFFADFFDNPEGIRGKCMLASIVVLFIICVIALLFVNFKDKFIKKEKK